jgi:hypothetical protein
MSSEEVSGAVTRSRLAPVHRRGVWVAWGLVLQIVGVAIPALAALKRVNHDNAIGTVTHYTVRLILHEMLRHGGDVALVVLGVVVFVAGSVLLARPFVTRRLTLFVAVPLAAVAGMAVLGLFAVVIAAIVAIAAQGGGGASGPGTVDGLLNWNIGGARRRRRR